MAQQWVPDAQTGALLFWTSGLVFTSKTCSTVQSTFGKVVGSKLMQHKSWQEIALAVQKGPNSENLSELLVRRNPSDAAERGKLQKSLVLINHSWITHNYTPFHVSSSLSHRLKRPGRAVGMGTHPAPTLRAPCPKPVLCLLRETAGSVEPGLPFPTSDFGEPIFRSMNHTETGAPHLSSPSYASASRAKGNSSPTKTKGSKRGLLTALFPGLA